MDIIADHESESELQQLGDQLLIDVQTGIEIALASTPHIPAPHFRDVADSVVAVVRNNIKDFLRKISNRRSSPKDRKDTPPSGGSLGPYESGLSSGRQSATSLAGSEASVYSSWSVNAGSTYSVPPSTQMFSRQQSLFMASSIPPEWDADFERVLNGAGPPKYL